MLPSSSADADDAACAYVQAIAGIQPHVRQFVTEIKKLTHLTMSLTPCGFAVRPTCNPQVPLVLPPDNIPFDKLTVAIRATGSCRFELGVHLDGKLYDDAIELYDTVDEVMAEIKQRFVSLIPIYATHALIGRRLHPSIGPAKPVDHCKFSLDFRTHHNCRVIANRAVVCVHLDETAVDCVRYELTLYLGDTLADVPPMPSGVPLKTSVGTYVALVSLLTTLFNAP